MKETRKKIIVAALVLLLSMLCQHFATNSSVGQSSPTTTIHVQSVTKPVCTNFTINITVTDVNDLNSFSLHLSYNNSLMEYLNASDGGFLSGGTFKKSNKTGDLYAISSGPPASASGSGTLVIVTFHCISDGVSNLTLHDVQLRDSMDRQIQFVIENGTCTQERMFRDTLYIDHNFTLCNDMYSSGSFLVVNASNVVVDLNGHSITCNGTLGTAVKVNNGMSNVWIMNGTVIKFQKSFTMTNCTDVHIINTQILFSSVTSIEVIRSKNIQIANNIIDGYRQTSGEAIYLDNSSAVNISNNLISENYCGIFMENHADNNTINKNQITSNTYVGIELSTCNQNKFWSNDFTQNTKHVKSDGSTNTWDLGYLFGNYWDDYHNQSIDDNHSGQNHTLSGPDGIGDKPYIINQNNADNYPLMNPRDHKLQMFEPSAVAIYSDSDISNFDFNETACNKISFNVADGYFCKVIIPNILLDGAVEAEVDGTPAASVVSWDENHVFVNITFQGIHQIQIAGEFVCKMIWKGDLNGDGIINILDIAIVAQHYKP